SDAPNTLKAVELKEEIVQNLIEKYHDLLNEGKSEQAAYNISVASIGDVNELLRSIEPNNTAAASAQQKSAGTVRNALMTAIAVMLYILSPVPCILMPDSEMLGPVLLFVIVAIATGLLIFNSIMKKQYKKSDDTMVENFKEWNQKEQSRKSLRRAVNTIIWSLTLIAYFVVSFSTGAWYITWIIFLMGTTACAINGAVFELLR
ncbi:MAG: permease prefix domain 1-containing protein, partial [Acutalibacteraceae bacterium]